MSAGKSLLQRVEDRIAAGQLREAAGPLASAVLGCMGS